MHFFIQAWQLCSLLLLILLLLESAILYFCECMRYGFRYSAYSLYEHSYYMLFQQMAKYTLLPLIYNSRSYYFAKNRIYRFVTMVYQYAYIIHRPSHLLHADFLLGWFSSFKMWVMHSSETSVYMRTTRRYIPEDGNVNGVLCIIWTWHSKNPWNDISFLLICRCGKAILLDRPLKSLILLLIIFFLRHSSRLL
jgi:hypothetical protein